jgi:hypothetical protein
MMVGNSLFATRPALHHEGPLSRCTPVGRSLEADPPIEYTPPFVCVI